MDSYESIVQLRNNWKQGKFKFPETVTIAGIEYRLYKSSDFTFDQVIIQGKKPAIIYHTSEPHKKEAIQAGLHQWIVFVWTVTGNTNIIPYDVYPVAPQRYAEAQATGFTRRSDRLSTEYDLGESQERIGDVAILKIFLPSGTAAIKGRVDTGAEISSLHADNFKVMGEMVKFANSELSKNIITAPLVDQQQVKSADGGVEYRPVIALNIEINGKAIKNALFNLNDREQMEYPCLIGQNVLEKTNFLIDPKMNEKPPSQEIDQGASQGGGWLPEGDYDIDWDLLQEELDKEMEDTPDDVINSIVQIMVETNMTLPDLIKHVRSDALQDLKNYQK